MILGILSLGKVVCCKLMGDAKAMELGCMAESEHQARGYFQPFQQTTNKLLHASVDSSELIDF